MEEVTVLPSRSASKRTRSTNTSRESSRREYTTKSSSGSSTPRAPKPSLSRTTSAPPIPPSKDPKLTTIEDESEGYNLRDSITSIKDDPFFRNYQSPRSVSLTRELRSATCADDRDEELPSNPLPKSAQRPSVDNSVNLPVCAKLLARKMPS